jgi:endo-1,4-beta-D-glucanase Y
MRWRHVPALAALAGLCACAGGGGRGTERPLLEVSWDAYRDLYIHPSGYVLDETRGGGETISEGQSYALLRAGWMGDRETFARVFAWTEEHLRRPDGLYAWRWSAAEGGRVLDWNTASDGDQDIAFALIIAAYAFDEPAYLDRARELVRAIRTHEAIHFSGGWYPAAGNWAVEERIVNLSYFAPYAYPYFDRLDPEGNWMGALRGGYLLLARALSRGPLIPDFMTVDAEGHVGPLPPGSQHTGDYAYDALRIHWRVAVDCQLHHRPEACKEDPSGLGFLAERLANGEAVVSRYSTKGEPLTEQVSLSSYGALLPGLRQYHPRLAEDVRGSILSRQALEPVFKRRDRYYDLNWVWFGIAADGDVIRDGTPSLEEFDRLLARTGSGKAAPRASD